MAKVEELTTEDLELLIEQKVLEILGDPDSGLELKEEFKTQLRERYCNSAKNKRSRAHV